MEPVLLFLHLPKTAGSAVTDVVRGRFDPSEIRSVSGPDYLAAERKIFAASAEDKATVRLVDGHFSFGLHRAFEQPARYYTIVRDPVDRLVSLYYYTRSTPSHPRCEQARSMSLADYALSGIHPEIENCQTRMLSGRQESNFIAGTEPCSEEDLQRAKQHLCERFVSVGLFEALDLSLYLLSRTMAWPTLRADRRNVTKARRSVEDLAPDELAAARRVNAFDLQLYDFARARFREQLGQLSWWERLRLGVGARI